MTEPRELTASALDDVVRDVAQTWFSGIGAWVATGHKLEAFKKNHGHGNFGRCFKNHREPFASTFPFAIHTAQRLMAVARNHVLSKAAHARLSLSDLTVLANLAGFPDDKLRIVFDEAWVSPETRRRDIKEIRTRLGIESKPRKARAPKVIDAKAKHVAKQSLAEFVDATQNRGAS